jgi:NCS1 family nucleobase:cation symporter-1
LPPGAAGGSSGGAPRGFSLLTFNLWTTNDNTAYAFGVAGAELANRNDKRPFIIIGVIVGIALAVTGVANALTGFLVTLGTVIPPLGGVIIGTVMTLVATGGYHVVAQVSNYAAPWMLLIFIGCALATIPNLESRALNDIWTGVPFEGNPKIGFWGVFFFAWFCNAAMHMGMSDMSVLRYARKASSGWAPAAGMYLGHCIAWICASLLFAYQLQKHGPNASVAPGPMVFEAVGWAGLVCVVIAGWTTANPTIYRAGLAFQGVLPKLSRASATLLAGAVCTIAGLFPAFAMQLLGFVGIYGMVLAPVGAIIVVDVFLADRLGIARDPAAAGITSFNVAALIAWVVPAAIGFWAVGFFEMPLPTYATLPVWIGSGVVYIILSKLLNPAPENSRQPA